MQKPVRLPNERTRVGHQAQRSKIPPLSPSTRSLRPWRASYCSRRYSVQQSQLAAMPERRYAKLLEVFHREVGQDRLVYLILAEYRLVLPKAQAPEPDDNVHDGANNRGWRASSDGKASVSRTDRIFGVSKAYKDRCRHIVNGGVYR